jgi:hypothetical protein
VVSFNQRAGVVELAQFYSEACVRLSRFVGLAQKRLRNRLSKRPTLEKKPLIEIMADLVEPTKTVVVSAS